MWWCRHLPGTSDDNCRQLCFNKYQIPVFRSNLLARNDSVDVITGIGIVLVLPNGFISLLLLLLFFVSEMKIPTTHQNFARILGFFPSNFLLLLFIRLKNKSNFPFQSNKFRFAVNILENIPHNVDCNAKTNMGICFFFQFGLFDSRFSYSVFHWIEWTKFPITKKFISFGRTFYIYRTEFRIHLNI